MAAVQGNSVPDPMDAAEAAVSRGAGSPSRRTRRPRDAETHDAYIARMVDTDAAQAVLEQMREAAVPVPF